MRVTYITALAIAIALAVWMLSGLQGEDETPPPGSIAEANARAEAVADDQAPTRVRARVIESEPYSARLIVRGRTENKRTVIVKSETSGKIDERPVEKGDRVEKGALLCRISTDDRDAALGESRQALDQARIDYAGVIKLKQQGLVSDWHIAESKTKLAAAEAQLAKSELELSRTRIRAPFAGIVEDLHTEIGDYVSPGVACATIVDLNPMLLVGSIAEKNVIQLVLGSTVEGRLVDGRSVSGTLTFVGQQSDPDTRTYPFEIQVPNEDFALRSGITAEIGIPTGEMLAHKITPALLALDDAGNTGIRLLDDDNRVEFHPVEILAQERDGIWLTGLPDRATVITVGQEMVVPGEQVEPVFEASDNLPARAEDEPGRKDEDLPAASSGTSEITTLNASSAPIARPA